MIAPYYEEPGITIYCADCRDVLPQLPEDAAIVSDPPYGMRRHGRYQCGANSDSHVAGFRSNAFGQTVHGDDKPFDPSPWLKFPEVILWGFNHFPQALSKGSVFVWLKRYDDGFATFLSDAELAWFNSGCGVYCRRDMSLQGESNIRAHPSQKPVGIMRWCTSFTKAQTILDPFMGSGTTLVAAKQLGRRAIGIEIEEKYVKIAIERLRQEVLPFDAPREPEPEPLNLFA